MTSIKTDMSVRGLERAIEELLYYKNKVRLSEEQSVLKLITEGEVLAKENAKSLINGEGLEEAISQTTSFVSGNSGKIANTSPKATYAEFGTGIVGKSSPHPNNLGWVYDVNKHGEKGWWFPTNNPSLISKTGKNGSSWGWTKGNESQPFMWETAKQLRAIAPSIVKNILKGGGL